MRVVTTIGALLLIATPVSAQRSVPSLNTVSADNQSAGRAWLRAPRCAGGITYALRHQIDAIQAGQPDYDAMEKYTANALRDQIARIEPSLTAQWGKLVSLKSVRHMPAAGTYEAQFERARVRWQITCASTQGKITGLSFQTLS
jgi:hypothetical protein